MTVAGIVSHLRWCEELWFREVLLGQPGRAAGSARWPTTSRTPSSSSRASRWRRCCRSTTRSAPAPTPPSPGTPSTLPGSTVLHSVGTASLRWILLHMLEETARHAGHLDLIRELLDGETGYF